MSKPSAEQSTSMPAGGVVAGSEPIAPPSSVLGGNVERPPLGPFTGDLLVSGWILCVDGPAEWVTADTGSIRLARVRANRERPDIAEGFSEVPRSGASGFRIRLPRAAVSGLSELTLAAETTSGELIPFWTVRLAVDDGASAVPRPPAGRRRRRWRAGGAAAVEHPTAVVAPGAERAPSAAGQRAGPYPRVVALIATFNEADIIAAALEHLAENGVESYLIDDGSTDATVAVAERWLGRGLLGVERFQAAEPGKTSWRAILQRKLELARELGADWFIHHDADEFRESPWPNTTLHQAIAVVDRLGYNAIDFRVLNFPPVDDTFRPGDDPRRHFRRWEGPAEYDRVQRKAWKATGVEVALEDGGHEVRFPGRRLFPVRFLLRHYPVRSQAHGTRKVLDERRGRFVEGELALGWHRQYDHVSGRDHSFLRNPASLRAFDLERIRLETLLEDRGELDGPGDATPGYSDGADRDRGCLDRVSTSVISGWAVRADRDEPLTVEIWDGGRPLAQVRADGERPDLAEQGLGGGLGGFTIRTPRELLDGRPHWIWATVADSGAPLRRSPIALHGGGGRAPAATATARPR